MLGIEPRPGSFALLERIVRLVGLGAWVSLAPVALGDRSATVTLRVPVVPTRAHLPGDARHARAMAA
ncbi:MAG: hypothetical protein ACOCT8_04695, partial [Actinomycetota bacterium]